MLQIDVCRLWYVNVIMNLLITLQATQGKFPNLTSCPDYRSRSFFRKVRSDVR